MIGQNLCGHSKVNKDMSLTANVPPLKKSMETLIFRVKAMLEANRCLTAFWIGAQPGERQYAPKGPTVADGHTAVGHG